MSKPQKVLTIVLWILAVGGMMGVVALQLLPRTRPVGSAQASVQQAAVVASAPGLPIYYSTPDFSLTDQLGHAVSNVDLRGRPWVADFFFTTCGSICPAMSHKMSGLQKTLPPQVRLVSFTVDPQHDTPAILADYAKKYQADDTRWLFLTGDPKMQLSVVQGMKLFAPAGDRLNPVQHTAHFVLVDAAGQVRGVYDTDIPGEIDHLIRDASTLVNSGSEVVRP